MNCQARPKTRHFFNKNLIFIALKTYEIYNNQNRKTGKMILVLKNRITTLHNTIITPKDLFVKRDPYFTCVNV